MQATPGAVAGFLKNAESFFALSKSLLAGAPLATEPMQIFTNAYEGYHQVVQAVLEFYEVRTKEAARAMAIQRAAAFGDEVSKLDGGVGCRGLLVKWLLVLDNTVT